MRRARRRCLLLLLCFIVHDYSVRCIQQHQQITARGPMVQFPQLPQLSCDYKYINVQSAASEQRGALCWQQPLKGAPVYTYLSRLHTTCCHWPVASPLSVFLCSISFNSHTSPLPPSLAVHLIAVHFLIGSPKPSHICLPPLRPLSTHSGVWLVM